MNGLVLAAVWLAAGAVAWILGRTTRRPRLAALGPLVILVVAAVIATGAGGWNGPFGTASSFAQLGRVPLGYLILAAAGLAATRALAPAVTTHDVLAASVVGAAATVAIGAGNLLIWSVGIAVALAALTLRWIVAAPSRVTLTAPRVAGLGAAALVAALPFVPVEGGGAPAWPLLVGWLVAGGMCAVLAVFPFSGWATGSLQRLAGPDAVLWTALIAPAVLLSAATLPAEMPLAVHKVVLPVLLGAGLATAIWNGYWACRGAAQDRHVRVLLADIGLAVAAIASGDASASSAVLLILLGHGIVAPILLNRAAPPAFATRAAWLALSGLPPSISFWGRMVVLEACGTAGGVALTVAAIATIALGIAGVFALEARPRTSPVVAAHRWANGLAGIIAITALVAGLAPSAAAHLVFGQL